MIHLILAVLLVASVTGCARHYWSKPGGSITDFEKDSRECARLTAENPTAAAHGIVDEKRYRGCLTERGWTRDKHWQPPPPGWFRGIE
jgi:hypothetical protein